MKITKFRLTNILGDHILIPNKIFFSKNQHYKKNYREKKDDRPNKLRTVTFNPVIASSSTKNYRVYIHSYATCSYSMLSHALILEKLIFVIFRNVQLNTIATCSTKNWISAIVAARPMIQHSLVSFRRSGKTCPQSHLCHQSLQYSQCLVAHITYQSRLGLLRATNQIHRTYRKPHLFRATAL